MKTQLKTLAMLAGMILVLLLAIPTLIVSFLVALALQIVLFCVPLASAVVGGILLGIASAITNKEPSLTEKQQTVAQWFVCWPLLGLMRLIEQSMNWLMRKISSIPGVQVVES